MRLPLLSLNHAGRNHQRLAVPQSMIWLIRFAARAPVFVITYNSTAETRLFSGKDLRFNICGSDNTSTSPGLTSITTNPSLLISTGRPLTCIVFHGLSSTSCLRATLSMVADSN